MRKEVRTDSTQLTNKIEANRLFKFLEINNNQNEFAHQLIEMGRFKRGEDYIIYEDPVQGREVKVFFLGYDPLIFLIKYLKGESGNKDATMNHEINVNMEKIERIDNFINESISNFPQMKNNNVPNAADYEKIMQVKNRVMNKLAQLVDKEIS